MELTLRLPYRRVIFKVQLEKSRETAAETYHHHTRDAGDFALQRARQIPPGPDFYIHW